MKPHIIKLLSDFLDSFEHLFDTDWDYAQEILKDPKDFIALDGTFLNPKIEDESNNWASRGHLLGVYRQLLSELRKDSSWRTPKYLNNFKVHKIIGDKLLGLCPFHEEKTPSFYVNIKTFEYKCLSCKLKGQFEEGEIDFNKIAEEAGKCFAKELLGPLTRDVYESYEAGIKEYVDGVMYFCQGFETACTDAKQKSAPKINIVINKKEHEIK